MVPLNVQRLDTLAVSAEAPFEGFLFLKPAIANEIERGLGAGRALYIETEYFGGRGEQSAALFEDGRLVWRGAESNAEPVFQKTWHQPYFDLATRTQRKSSISQGLSMLGVVPSADGDEFDRLGLGHFRSLHALFG